MSFKSALRAVTPPFLWSAAKAFAPTPDMQAPQNPGDPIMLGYVLALEKRFPELRDFGFDPTPQNAADIAGFYADYLPQIYAPARSANLRSLLVRLGDRTQDAKIRKAAIRAIAVSDLHDGMPDRSKILAQDNVWGGTWADETDRLERAYGAALVRGDWSRAERGRTLIAFFDAHRALLTGKKILHFAPESELREWFVANRDALGLADYFTSGANGSGTDQVADITEIPLPADSFDVIICHRVMEHVLDDAKALSELRRILRPGGFVSFSVPQATQRAVTAEWVIPDESHHGHVRQYGADLEDRARSAGFRVELVTWLLNQSSDFFAKNGAYPMRVFHLWK